MGNQDDWQRVSVRFPPVLHRELKRLAGHHARSINAELIHLVQQALEVEHLKHNGVQEESQRPEGRIFRLSEALPVESMPERETTEDEEDNLVSNYRRLAFWARTPIQALVQALATRQP